jgi:hypothetical protein
MSTGPSTWPSSSSNISTNGTDSTGWYGSSGCASHVAGPVKSSQTQMAPPEISELSFGNSEASDGKATPAWLAASPCPAKKAPNAYLGAICTLAAFSGVRPPAGTALPCASSMKLVIAQYSSGLSVPARLLGSGILVLT